MRWTGQGEEDKGGWGEKVDIPLFDNLRSGHGTGLFSIPPCRCTGEAR